MTPNIMTLHVTTQFVYEHFLILLQKIMEVYMFPAIGRCATMITTFDLRMSRSGYDTFGN
jgi:hypothetical protein